MCEYVLNLPAYLATDKPPTNEEVASKCGYMQMYTDVSYIRAVSIDEPHVSIDYTDIFIPYEKAKKYNLTSVHSKDLDAMAALKKGFYWSMGELYIYPPIHLSINVA